MKIYRSPMEKILDKQQRDEIISNPKEPFRTLLRKLRFTISKWSDRVRNLFRRNPAVSIFDEISPGGNEGDILGEVDCRANTGAHGAGCFSTLIGSLSGKDD